jgi:branched-chain amino acid aminotransferase
MRKIWLNGEILPETEAKISIYDSALMFGDMVFEMTRSFNKNHFKLEEHVKRLAASAKYVGIWEFSEEEVLQACREVTRANEFHKNDEYRLMINLTRGVLGIYKDVVDVPPRSNLMVTNFPLRWTVRGMSKYYQKGINMVIAGKSIPHDIIDSKVKHRSRLNFQLANIKASKFKGEDNWALLTDNEGYITEGTGDNFFIVKNNKVITPDCSNALDGISRQFVLEMCGKLNINVEIKKITLYEAITADEAFITGTPFCILPVSKINNINVGSNHYEITFKLLKKWSDIVQVDIIKQIQEWDDENNEEENPKTTPYTF